VHLETKRISDYLLLRLDIMNLSKIRLSKTHLGASLAAAALAVPLMGQGVLAQSQQICIVEQDSNRVFCGRAATNREVSNAGYGRLGNRGYGNSRHGGRDRRGDNRYETASSRRDWSDAYDELDDIYKDVLGRNIDRDGLRTYVRRLEQGWSLSQIRRDVVNSDEAEDALNQVYRRILGRDIDADGFRTYRRKIARGESLRDVARDLQKSDEARRRR